MQSNAGRFRDGRSRRGALLAVLALIGSGLANASAAPALQGPSRDGPTPYPARLEDWPGRGQVRVFPWMIDNRAHFWRQRSTQQGAIVLAGDSLVAGWPSLEADVQGAPLANRGMGGDTSRGLLFRFAEDVLALRPRAIVILIGTNDLSAGQSAADTVFNVARMLERVRARSSTLPVVLCTLPPRDHPQAVVAVAKVEELNAGFSKLATEYPGVSLLDLFALLADDRQLPVPEYFMADRLHLAAQGYRVWGRALHQQLLDAGVIGTARP